MLEEWRVVGGAQPFTRLRRVGRCIRKNLAGIEAALLNHLTDALVESTSRGDDAAAGDALRHEAKPTERSPGATGSVSTACVTDIRVGHPLGAPDRLAGRGPGSDRDNPLSR